MRRSDNGHWGLPGGYVEAGESVTDAVAREVFEETGVRIEVGRLVGIYSDPKRQVIEYGAGRRVQAVNLCFEARAVAQGEPTTPHETLELGYFPLEALPEPLRADSHHPHRGRRGGRRPAVGAVRPGGVRT